MHDTNTPQAEQPDKYQRAISDYANPDTNGKFITFMKACEINGVRWQTMFEQLQSRQEIRNSYALAREARANADVDKMCELDEKLLAGAIDVQAYRALTANQQWRAARGDKSRFSEHTTSETKTVHELDFSGLSDAALAELIPLLESKAASGE